MKMVILKRRNGYSRMMKETLQESGSTSQSFNLNVSELYFYFLKKIINKKNKKLRPIEKEEKQINIGLNARQEREGSDVKA